MGLQHSNPKPLLDEHNEQIGENCGWILWRLEALDTNCHGSKPPNHNSSSFVYKLGSIRENID